MDVDGGGDENVMVMRDLHLLLRLFQGEVLRPRSLADEFGVGLRTIQRDMAQRLRPLLGDRLCRSAEGYYLTWAEDEQSEAIAAAVLKSLSERIGGRFHRHARALFRRMEAGTPFWIVSHMEDIGHKEREVRAIKAAIERSEGVAFDYIDKTGQPSRKTVFALLILNAQGVWYLLGWDRDRVKTYALRNIERITPSRADPPPEDLRSVIEGAINIWFTTATPPFEARFWVRRDLVYHFERLPLSKHQRLYEAHANGDCIYTITITSHNELLPTLKQYAPLTLPLHPPGLVEAFEAAIRETVEMMENVRKS